jgi:hypothetical protein
MDKITATMATFKLRERSLNDSITSIINQVDELWVYLNDYDYIPDYLINDKIKVFLGSECDGDIKAKGKFYKCGEIEGYHCTIDDDLIYPPDYIKTYLDRMVEYKDSVILTSLGKITKKNSTNYYKDNLYSFHFQRTVLNDYSVHMGGTGVMMYNTKTFKPDYDEILSGLYVDLFVGIQAQKQRIPIIVVKHEKDWIIFNKKESVNLKKSLYDTGQLNYIPQTQLMNSINWELILPDNKSVHYSKTPINKIESGKKKNSDATPNGNSYNKTSNTEIKLPEKGPESKPINNSQITSRPVKLHTPEKQPSISRVTNDITLGKLRKGNLRFGKR